MKIKAFIIIVVLLIIQRNAGAKNVIKYVEYGKDGIIERTVMYSYIDGTITSKDDIQFGPKGQKRIHTSFEILINNEGRDTIETIYENQWGIQDTLQITRKHNKDGADIRLYNWYLNRWNEQGYKTYDDQMRIIEHVIYGDFNCCYKYDSLGRYSGRLCIYDKGTYLKDTVLYSIDEHHIERIDSYKENNGNWKSTQITTFLLNKKKHIIYEESCPLGDDSLSSSHTINIRRFRYNTKGLLRKETRGIRYIDSKRIEKTWMSKNKYKHGLLIQTANYTYNGSGHPNLTIKTKYKYDVRDNDILYEITYNSDGCILKQKEWIYDYKERL